MEWIQILILALVQGAAELLPVSSSAHVILAGKLMKLDPTTPQMTFMIVMLHTGTMFSVLFYYRQRWKNWFWNRDLSIRKHNWKLLCWATILTLAVGVIVKKLIEKFILGGGHGVEMEQLFGRLDIISICLFSVGLLIIFSGLYAQKNPGIFDLNQKAATAVGLVQGLCIPLRGFSRSGATISTALFHRITPMQAEEFSFGLALILTPPAIGRMIWRLNHHGVVDVSSTEIFTSTVISEGIVGMLFAFIAGWFALRLLSRWLERGRWHFFGFYNLCAAVTIWFLSQSVFANIGN